MNALRSIIYGLIRLAIVWLVDAVTLILVALTIRGIEINPRVLGADSFANVVVIGAAAALMLGMVNLFARPIILLLALPFGFFVMFGAGFLVNAATLMLTSALLPGFDVQGIVAAILGGIFFGVLNSLLTGFLGLGDESGSFYEGLVERLARRNPFAGGKDSGTGLVMIEIDGLSYFHLQKALAGGWMPNLKRWIEQDGYALARMDCGLPSQTSSCQAGIMFGDNYDIPAFRWYDKDEQYLYVSGKDAAKINARYSKGQGLTRGGSSINNMMAGDAEKSLFTLANLSGGDRDEQKRRAGDVYLLMMNPYFFVRTIARFIGDAIKDVWQAWQQKRRGVWPRLNRLHHAYPLIRAATTVFMRDIPSYFVCLDIVRGSPSIYYTFPGYDEVAHHSGPWTTDAFDALRSFDRVLARIRGYAEHRAPRPYEVVVLSDHGQSFGPTFRQRYGVDLKTFIQSRMPGGSTVSQPAGGDDGVPSVSALAAELENVEQQGVGSGMGKVLVKGTKNLVDRGVAAQAGDAGPQPQAANVVAYGSGNVAQVYFDLHPRRIRMSELNAAYPGMVDALIQHEGIGFVGAYADDGAPVVYGKRGARNLHTGAVTGEDPLRMYADERATPEFRAAQIRRVMDFPHAGDLMVNSAVFPDGSVAALEELIGNHGGLGGEQTDAFLLYPGTWGDVPAISNSAELFPILNARRGRPPAPRPAPAQPEVSAWAPRTLTAGLGQAGRWLGLAGRALLLDRQAYREAAADPFMTAPALLLGVLGSVAASLAEMRAFDPRNIAIRVVLWLVSVLVVHLTARLMGGKANYTQTLRGMGFAATTTLLYLLSFVPVIAPLARLLVLLWSFVAAWIGASEAHGLRTWRSLVLPVLAVLLVVVAAVVIQILLAGAEFTVAGMMGEVGITPK